MQGRLGLCYPEVNIVKLMKPIMALGFVGVTVAVFLVACVSSLTSILKGGRGAFRITCAADPVSFNPNLCSDDSAFIAAQNVYNKLVTLESDDRLFLIASRPGMSPVMV